MRKIERQMNDAITQGKDWKSDNTMVTTVNGVSHVFLHNNKIAEVGDNFIVLMDGGWQSNTTKSRLNAILREHGCSGECVFQQNFAWFVNMKNAKGEDMKVPFFSGMRLN
jgi:hypothetical protein